MSDRPTFSPGARHLRACACAGALVVCASLARGAATEVRYQVETWDAGKGLPSGTVTALAQTPDGYWWVGTPAGLARFDGVRFTTFNARNTPDLGSGNVRSLLSDTEGTLWIVVTDSALVRMKDGVFNWVRPPGPRANRVAIESLAAASDGTLWFTAGNGIVGSFREGLFQAAPPSLSAPEGPLRVQAGFAGAVRVSGPSEMVLCAGQDGMPERVGYGTELSPLTPSRQGGWWFAGPEGVRLWRDRGWVTAIPLASNSVGSVQTALEDSHGQLWLGTEQSGVFCFSTNAHAQHFTTAEGLGSDSVLCLFEDARGAIWVGTQRGGLSRIRQTPFRVIGRKDGLTSEFVTSVCAGTDGEVWVGTDGGGLSRLKDDAVDNPIGTKHLGATRIRAVCVDSARSVWVAAEGGRLFLGEAGEFKDRSALTTGAADVSALFEDARWQLWLGAVTANRLVRIVSEAPRVFTVPNSSPALDVRCLAEDAEGRLWLGTEGSGLLRWDGRDFQRFTHTNGLGADTVWALLADPREQVLWIGTSGGGLSCLSSNIIKTCTMRHGLHDEVICHIAEDDQGWLWFGSHKGIFRVAKADLLEFIAGKRRAIQSVVYGITDGLPTQECAGGLQPAGCRTRDGRLWFPTAKGLVVVNPTDVQSDAVPPRIRLEEVLVDDAPLDPSSTEPAGVLLGPGPHRVLFRFTALGAVAPEWLRFCSQLEGFDPDWVDLGGQRSVQYSGLRPGQYRFRVRAINRDGVGSAEDGAFAFHVAPQFWETWWFRLAGALALAGSVAAIVTWVLRRQHRARIERLELLHAVERERARIAQDIHDDLGASLTQIALLSELAQSQLHEPQNARGHLDLIFTNARKLARATDEIVWALHPKNNAVETSLNFLTRFAQEYLRVAGLPCRLDIPAELPEASLPSATRHHLYLALKEALNNVVKHAAATEVWLRLRCHDDFLVLTVEDNGRGFDRTAVGAAAQPSLELRRGNGLQSMEHRMRSVGGNFEQTSAPGRGTVTRLTVPLRK